MIQQIKLQKYFVHENLENYIFKNIFKYTQEKSSSVDVCVAAHFTCTRVRSCQPRTGILKNLKLKTEIKKQKRVNYERHRRLSRLFKKSRRTTQGPGINSLSD